MNEKWFHLLFTYQRDHKNRFDTTKFPERRKTLILLTLTKHRVTPWNCGKVPLQTRPLNRRQLRNNIHPPIRPPRLPILKPDRRTKTAIRLILGASNWITDLTLKFNFRLLTLTTLNLLKNAWIAIMGELHHLLQPLQPQRERYERNGLEFWPQKFYDDINSRF